MPLVPPVPLAILERILSLQVWTPNPEVSRDVKKASAVSPLVQRQGLGSMMVHHDGVTFGLSCVVRPRPAIPVASF
jgi:hypothetical protein